MDKRKLICSLFEFLEPIPNITKNLNAYLSPSKQDLKFQLV
jgi:hypothetical protein